MFESLESRTYMHTAVQSMRADNRGEGYLYLTEAANPATVTSASVMVFTGGADKVLGTADDVRVLASVKYTASSKRVFFRVKENLPPDTGYMVKIFGSRLKAADGDNFDGEFNGTFPSGDGVAGGDFRIQTKKDRTALPQVRFNTSAGTIDIQLFHGSGPTRATPSTVAHFLGLVNSGAYDNNVIHRLASEFVIQWGGLNVDPTTNQLGLVDEVGGSVEPSAEAGNSNVIGTMAFAIGDADGNPNTPSTGTNEFFFNMANNNGTGSTPNLDNTSNGGPFVPFGQVYGSMATLTAISQLHRLDLSQALAGAGSSVDNFPVNSSVPVTGETAGRGGTTAKTLDPLNDFVVVRRVAVRMKLAAIA